MKISHLAMIIVFLSIACLAVPGAIRFLPANAYGILLQRTMAGIILMLVVIYNRKLNSHNSFCAINREAMNWMLLGVTVAILVIPFMYGPNNFNGSQANIFRIHWTVSLMMVYFLASGVYFLLYELALRGIFLDWLKRSFNLPMAVSSNVLVYACMHVPKSFSEALICVPFGLLLCMATVRTNSILPAMLMHMAIGLSLEGTIIYHINDHI